MDAPAAMRPGRPQNVGEIVESALSYSFNINIPFKHWTRAADTLWQEGSFALRDGDLRRAYMMLYRHSNLVLELLPTHPAFKSAESRNLYRPVYDRLPKVLRMLEDLKPPINKEYDEWKLMKRDAKKTQDAGSGKPSTYEQFAARDPTLSGNAKILDAAEHQELAVDLAQREFQRMDAVKWRSRQTGITEEEERRRRQGGSWDDWDGSTPRNGAAHARNEDQEIRHQLEAARQRLTVDEKRVDDTSRRIVGAINHNLSRPTRPGPPVAGYSYPAIAKSQPIRYDSNTPSANRDPTPHRPAKPPKEFVATASSQFDQQFSFELPAPPLPGREPLSYRDAPTPEPLARPGLPELPPKEDLLPPQVEEPSSRKARVAFKPAAYLENGDPIRPVFLPKNLRQSFLDIAEENTRRGLEMCGILCGTPVNNALFIKCLLIPEQKCTTDTCETENESAMLDYCINEDLLMLGWIHTHPTQTCFMSSRDLHTQAGYQVMMPESIAIVCSPRFEPAYGIFRLTNPPGLQHILQCTHSDTFHQHSIDNVYTGCEHPPGHVYETSKMDFVIHDLRPGRKN